MTGNAVNAKSEALELHELSSKELDAVSGGSKNAENKKQAEALKAFQEALKSL
jgi:bacteriocin-like protein